MDVIKMIHVKGQAAKRLQAISSGFSLHAPFLDYEILEVHVEYQGVE